MRQTGAPAQQSCPDFNAIVDLKGSQRAPQNSRSFAGSGTGVTGGGGGRGGRKMLPVDRSISSSSGKERALSVEGNREIGPGKLTTASREPSSTQNNGSPSAKVAPPRPDKKKSSQVLNSETRSPVKLDSPSHSSSSARPTSPSRALPAPAVGASPSPSHSQKRVNSSGAPPPAARDTSPLPTPSTPSRSPLLPSRDTSSYIVSKRVAHPSHLDRRRAQSVDSRRESEAPSSSSILRTPTDSPSRPHPPSRSPIPSKKEPSGGPSRDSGNSPTATLPPVPSRNKA